VLPLNAEGRKETLIVLQQTQPKVQSALVYTIATSVLKFTELKRILQKTATLSDIKSYDQGNILLTSANNKLFIGQSQSAGGEASDLTYTWREITLPSSIMTFDAQINIGKSKSSRKVPFLDVAVGLNEGAIVLYEDLLFKIISKEKKNSTEDLLSRKLHWHRSAVNTLKWSRDRNYLVSGGSESVLVIWQLDTNQKQFLPHLSTSILGLTVSAAGSAYALRLGDNSVMVLSTADLLPSALVSGLALGDALASSSPVVLHPNDANQLIAAVPANAVAKDTSRGKSSTFLQMYDVESNAQIHRQALTRNVTTAVNVAPTGQSVKEPDVTHIAVSHDGKWLATVDEWRPNEQDLDSVYVDADGEAVRGAGVETNLRLWAWVGDESHWGLVTRVDEPHKPGARSVLGLAFNPVKLEISTIGSDGAIHVWSPKARHRNGVAVKSKSNAQLYTWAGSRTILCDPEAAVGQAVPASSATLAYSDDGSVLAASWSWPTTSSPRFVHLVNPVTGRICLSQPELLVSGHAKLTFAGRYLVCLSRTLTIFDTLTTQILVDVALDPDFVAPQSNFVSQMATNKFDGTVAVSVSRSDRPWATKVLVLSLVDSKIKPVFENSFSGRLKSLLAITTGPGYLFVDDKNRFRSLRPTGVGKMLSPQAALAGAPQADQAIRSLDSIFGSAPSVNVPADDEAAAAASGQVKALLTSADIADPSRTLDAVFRFTSSSQAPSPAELFQRVVAAVARG
jgi:NET1-associated nuclear protein 1 (U3 small nucleolar RNA-associated protein 17)